MSDMQIAGWVAVVAVPLLTGWKYAVDASWRRFPRVVAPGPGRHRREEAPRG